MLFRSGVAVIKVGAATEVELKERKHRIEDAVRNAKAAVEEGIVAGGGVALLQASQVFEKLELEGDEATGANAVRVALEAPLKQIAVNAGLEGRRCSTTRRASARTSSRCRPIRPEAQAGGATPAPAMPWRASACATKPLAFISST